MTGWLRSIQGQVALRLAVVFVVATVLGVGTLLYEGMQQASLQDASDADALAHALLREFVLDLSWAIPLFAAATLGVGVWAVRSALRPLRSASERAAAIAPDAAGVRLPVEALPSELVPLVAAVNHAFDRLEQGFAAQRQFTANAAHELRTPLAILTAGLEALNDGPEVAKLRTDTDRMNRLVEQIPAGSSTCAPRRRPSSNTWRPGPLARGVRWASTRLRNRCQCAATPTRSRTRCAT